MLCLYCQRETNNPKFCNNSCSAKFNNIGIRRHGKSSNNCLHCNKPTSSYKTIYCSQKCHILYETKLLHDKIKANEQCNWRRIKDYLIEINGKCHICLIDKWNDKPIMLECDHIDGDISNNCLSNARLLCPNCHSQTETFKFKNYKNPNGKEKRKIRYYKSIKVELLTGFEPAFSEPLRING